jgi:hypothetical protein
MKKIVLISAIVMSGLYYNTANAQIRLRLGFHFGARPVYAPARVVVEQQTPVEYTEPTNYDGDEDYYYLPDVDAYYSVTEQCYYYNDGGQWVSAAYLPGEYRNYDWRNERRFEVRAPRPFMHNNYYRAQYNGVAFNGRWNERNYNHENYANANINHDQYRRDDRRFDNNHQYDQNRGQQNFDRNRGQDNRQYNQNRGQQNVDGNRSADNRQYDQDRSRNTNTQQHFAQNVRQNNNRDDRGDHRQGRF